MVHGAFNFIDKIKRYTLPTKGEKKCLLKGALTISIILLISEIIQTTILTQQITTQHIILHALLFVIITPIMILIYESTQKIIAAEQGTKTEINYTKQKTIIGLVSSLFTIGIAPILAYKNTKFYSIERHRLGHLFHGKSINLMAKSVIGATIALTILAGILQTIPTIGNKLAEATMLYAVSNLLPIPNQDGLAILYVHKILYITVLSITASILLISLAI